MAKKLAGYCSFIFLLIPFHLCIAEDQIPQFIKIQTEVKVHYRWSEDERFRLSFPFPPEFIPRGQTAVFERTVSPGSSLEVSVASVMVDLRPADALTGRIRLQFIDLYNRNPTTTDSKINVKEAWLMFGRRYNFMESDAGTSIYLLFGKAPKFERQMERNTETYGLVATAFNRLEDLQLQTGGGLGNHFYWRAQVSAGNPVFFRDPNLLAGDNGNDDLRLPQPELHLNSGFPILYDADVEDVSFRDNFELGGGFGFRWQTEEGTSGVDFLGFYYERELAERVDLTGTFYGGDLDLLDGTGGISLPISGTQKREYGANFDLRWRGFALFSQYVNQKMAGLERDGYELEMTARFPLPLVYSAGGRQLFTFIQPVGRFSFLDNHFRGSRLFVAPSTFWDWKKYDVGIRLGIYQGVDVTTEFSINDIEAPVDLSLKEFVTTLRARF